ncbi:MAG TPA: hypothetical protein VE959_21385 [Bryobacteraceae bacterium]|nr:hypothetical protein [Bryobacteraceae bacterium]
MPRPKTSFARLSRGAALRVALCAAFILGSCALVLQSTVWNQPKSAEVEPFYTDLPGVDLSGLPAARKEALLRELNSRRCPCECMRTMASCRNHHDSCSMSLAAARKALAEAGSK